RRGRARRLGLDVPARRVGRLGGDRLAGARPRGGHGGRPPGRHPAGLRSRGRVRRARTADDADGMDPLGAWLLQLLPVHGPWVLFVLAALETSFVTGLVVPSGMATSFATALALEGSVAAAPMLA